MRALHIEVTDREAHRPVWLALVLLTEIQRLHPDSFRITNDGFTQMLGSRWARESFERGEDPTRIWARWQEDLDRWEDGVERYRLYP